MVGTEVVGTEVVGTEVVGTVASRALAPRTARPTRSPLPAADETDLLADHQADLADLHLALPLSVILCMYVFDYMSEIWFC